MLPHSTFASLFEANYVEALECFPVDWTEVNIVYQLKLGGARCNRQYVMSGVSGSISLFREVITCNRTRSLPVSTQLPRQFTTNIVEVLWSFQLSFVLDRNLLAVSLARVKKLFSPHSRPRFALIDMIILPSIMRVLCVKATFVQIAECDGNIAVSSAYLPKP